MSETLIRFSKGLGFIGNAIDAASVVQEIKKSTENGNWQPTLLKIETLAAGAAATWAVGLLFTLVALTPISIIGFALIAAIISAMIDESQLEKFNKFLVNL